ncbi:MAG: hypothetical protein ABW156_11870, partial [Jiangellaceae bacterium]
MESILTRIGLLVFGVVMYWLAARLHKKAGAGGGGPQGGGKGNNSKKIIATVMAFLAGCALVGTFVGDWARGIGGMSPMIAAAFFLLTAGVLVIDWWSDGTPDRPAFIAAALLPLA